MEPSELKSKYEAIYGRAIFDREMPSVVRASFFDACAAIATEDPRGMLAYSMRVAYPDEFEAAAVRVADGIAKAVAP